MVAPMEVIVQKWTSFMAKHPNAHVLLGRTRDITQWRSADLMKSVKVQSPTGKFSLRRDLDGSIALWTHRVWVTVTGGRD